MRNQLRPFLLGFVIAFGGWFLLLVVRLEGELIIVPPVLIGLIAALASRRLLGLLGAVTGLAAWYALAFASGLEPGDGWQGGAIIFPLLIATGFAGGLAVISLRSARGTAARP